MRSGGRMWSVVASSACASHSESRLTGARLFRAHLVAHCENGSAGRCFRGQFLCKRGDALRAATSEHLHHQSQFLRSLLERLTKRGRIFVFEFLRKVPLDEHTGGMPFLRTSAYQTRETRAIRNLFQHALFVPVLVVLPRKKNPLSHRRPNEQKRG